MEEVIKNLSDNFVSVVALALSMTSMVMLLYSPRKLGDNGDALDDRMVSAFLHAEGPSTINQMSESCSTPHRNDINQSLVRLCARGIVERQDDSTRLPVFKLSEGAEVLIDP